MISHIDDRTAGRVMQAVAAAGVVVAVAGAVIGWSLLGRLDRASGDTLTVTGEALVAIEETIAVADGVVTSTVDALGAVEATLGELSDASGAAGPLLDGLGELGETAAPNLRSATDTLRSLEEAGTMIDTLLVAMGSLPGVPNYDPDQSLSTQFGRLADDVEPLADALERTARQVGPTAESVAELRERLDEVESAVGDVRRDLARSDALLSTYSDTAVDARRIADDTRQGLRSDVTAARILMVLAALTFAASQIVPFWFGRELLLRGPGTGAPPTTGP